MFKKKYALTRCADGFTVSIQADSRAYCSPRDDTGPYSSVELGYPSSRDSTILPWAEDAGNPTETVYGYVPSTVVLEMLESHGGWVSGEIPPMVLEGDQPAWSEDED